MNDKNIFKAYTNNFGYNKENNNNNFDFSFSNNYKDHIIDIRNCTFGNNRIQTYENDYNKGGYLIFNMEKDYLSHTQQDDRSNKEELSEKRQKKLSIYNYNINIKNINNIQYSDKKDEKNKQKRVNCDFGYDINLSKIKLGNERYSKQGKGYLHRLKKVNSCGTLLNDKDSLGKSKNTINLDVDSVNTAKNRVNKHYNFLYSQSLTPIPNILKLGNLDKAYVQKLIRSKVQLRRIEYNNNLMNVGKIIKGKNLGLWRKQFINFTLIMNKICRMKNFRYFIIKTIHKIEIDLKLYSSYLLYKALSKILLSTLFFFNLKIKNKIQLTYEYAVVEIQKNVRGFIFRKTFHYLLKTINLIKILFLVFNRIVYRYINNIKKFIYLKKVYYANYIRKVYLGYKIRKKGIIYYKSSINSLFLTLISSFHRCYSLPFYELIFNNRIHKIEIEKQTSTLIQSVYRGYKMRKIFKGTIIFINVFRKMISREFYKYFFDDLCKIRDKSKENERIKVIMIQKNWRGYKSRKKKYRYFSKKIKKIFDVIRGNIIKNEGKKIIDLLWKIREFKIKQENYSATLIEKCYRGYIQRKKKLVYYKKYITKLFDILQYNYCFLNKESFFAKYIEIYNDIKNRQNKASNKISACIRGYIIRKKRYAYYGKYLKGMINSINDFVKENYTILFYKYLLKLFAQKNKSVQCDFEDNMGQEMLLNLLSSSNKQAPGCVKTFPRPFCEFNIDMKVLKRHLEKKTSETINSMLNIEKTNNIYFWREYNRDDLLVKLKLRVPQPELTKLLYKIKKDNYWEFMTKIKRKLNKKNKKEMILFNMTQEDVDKLIIPSFKSGRIGKNVIFNRPRCNTFINFKSAELNNIRYTKTRNSNSSDKSKEEKNINFNKSSENSDLSNNNNNRNNKINKKVTFNIESNSDKLNNNNCIDDFNLDKSIENKIDKNKEIRCNDNNSRNSIENNKSNKENHKFKNLNSSSISSDDSNFSISNSDEFSENELIKINMISRNIQKKFRKKKKHKEI